MAERNRSNEKKGTTETKALGDDLTQHALSDLSNKLARDFDEKFFLLCADLSACKAAYEAAASQPFFRCGQWLWRSNSLKSGIAVPWNYETVNTDPENLIWEEDQPFIRVMDAGLLAIEIDSVPTVPK
ncbi:hypothetical protein HDU96_006787 [Phlyctochytrium bullatum]|nr:hypothetical protein HDU96_006787 [Phlyctochytrium bullatum]